MPTVTTHRMYGLDITRSTSFVITSKDAYMNNHDWQDFYSTANATLSALAESDATPGGSYIYDQHAPGLLWGTTLVYAAVDAEAGALEYDVHGYEDGTLHITRTYHDETLEQEVTLWEGHVNAHGGKRMGRQAFASAICNAIVRVPYVPLNSRSHAKKVEELARADASYRFAKGIDHLLGNGGSLSWFALDDPERWEEIQTASMWPLTNGLQYAQFMGQHRALGVPHAAMDVYDDVYHERAVELMASISPFEVFAESTLTS